MICFFVLMTGCRTQKLNGMEIGLTLQKYNKKIYEITERNHQTTTTEMMQINFYIGKIFQSLCFFSTNISKRKTTF